VEHCVCLLVGNLLGAEEGAMDFRIVNRRIIAAAAEGDLVAGPAKEFPGGFLQTPGGNAELQYRCRHGLAITSSCRLASDRIRVRRLLAADRLPPCGKNSSCTLRGTPRRRSGGP